MNGRKWRRLFGAVALGLAIGVAVGYRFAWFMAVDTCLDNGGRWVESADACDLSEGP